MEPVTKNLPVIAMRGLNVFPRMNTSFDLERPISVHALERAMDNGEEIFLVTQREIGHDTASYVDGLRASLRQAPDVILLGEMRDYETIQTAMTAAETGHLLISTLHTTGAANTIDRIIDVFPADGQQQVRVQLAMVLKAVVSQQLVPAVDGSLIPAFEIMFVNEAIRSMIRESKIHQIQNVISTSMAEGMVSLDNSLLKYLQLGLITRETCVSYSPNPEQMKMRLGV